MLKIAVIAFIFGMSLGREAYGWEMRSKDGKVQVAEWTYSGKPVWSDAEKGKIEASTPSAVFVATDITQKERDILSEIQADGGRSRSGYLAELSRRQSDTYNEQQAVSWQQKMSAAKALKLSTAAYQAQVNKFIGRKK